MTDKELVERLRENAEWAQGNEWETPLCLSDDLKASADRIEQLHTELTKEKIDNTNLIGELATVAAERDRYKAEVDAFMKTVRGNCSLCKHRNDYFDDDNCPCLHCEEAACRNYVTGNYWELRELEGNT